MLFLCAIGGSEVSFSSVWPTGSFATCFQDALNLPEEAGPVTKKKEEEDENPSPTDSVLLGHVSFFLQHLHGRVLIQPDAELGKLELNLISHFSDKDVAV